MKHYLPLIFKILLVCAALLVGSFFVFEPGYIKIAYGNGFVETTIAAFFVAVLALWLVEKILIKAWGLFGLRQKRSESLLSRGLVAYLAQDWKQAEKLLGRDKVPATHLYAALAAHELEDHEKVEKHLAKLNSKDQNLVVAKTELLLKQNKTAQAVELIKPIQRKHLSLYIRTLEANGEWAELLHLLPKIQKQVDDSFIEKILSHALVSEDHWKQIPSKIKKKNYAIARYVSALIASGKTEQAEQLLLKTLKKADISDFLPLIRKTKFSSTVNQHLQKALRADEHNLTLLCALGHAAANNQDYHLAGKALERAYEQNNNLDHDDLLVLADALTRTQQHQKATIVYQHFLVANQMSINHNS